MAARASLRVGFVVGDILVAVHAGCTVGPHLGLVNVVAGRAFGMPFAPRLVRNAMQPWQLVDLVTAAATGLGCHHAAVRLMTSHALPMPLRTPGELLVVTASTGDDASGLVSAPFVTGFAASMTQIATGETNLKRVTSAAQRPVAEPGQVESVRLMAGSIRKLARVKRGL